MSLSTLIVQREIASIREVEEALARQVLYGGDLITNLLEVCRLDEAQLLPVVAESLGLPPATPGELPQPDAEAKRLIAAEVAAERNLAPLSVDRYGLVVAVAEPLSAEVEQELAFALALPISQKIAPLVRIKQALARDYGLPLDRRAQRLLVRMTTEGPRSTSLPPHSMADMRLGAPRPPSMAPPPMPRIDVVMPGPGAVSGTRTFVRMTDVPPPPAPKRRRGGVTANAARTELEEAGERDTIFDLVFEFARQYFDYTALFIVHGDLAEGRDAYGDGTAREKFTRVGVPLDMPSLLKEARDSKSTVQREPARDGLDAVLMSDLGRSGKTVCVVIPIVVRTRVVALLLGDGGDTGVDTATLADVESIIGFGAAAFERLIVRKKLKGTIPPGANDALTMGDLARNPARVSLPPPTQVSGRPSGPSIEELAAPIRELMADPLTGATPDTRRHTPAPSAAALVKSISSSSMPAAMPASSGPPRKLEHTPPPPNILAVRRPSGRPIPREEPSADPIPPGSLTGAGSISSSPKGRRRGEAPSLDFGPAPTPPPTFVSETFVSDPIERRLVAEIQGSEPPAEEPVRPSVLPAVRPSKGAPPPSDADPPMSPKASSPPPAAVTDVSPGFMFAAPPPPSSSMMVSAEDSDVSVQDPDETPLAPPVDFDETPAAPPVAHPEPVVSEPARSSKPMPVSEQQISVAAHRPPSSRNDQSGSLPSVIVDVASEYVALVDRVVSAGTGTGTRESQVKTDDVEAELVRAGASAMTAIMDRFPGPVSIDASRLTDGPLPRVADCGPVMRMIAAQRRVALPFVLSHIADQDTDRRFWATYLLTELVYMEVLDHLFLRIFDQEERVRHVARAAARAFAESHAQAIVDRLEVVAQDGGQSRRRRALAIEALGETRASIAVGALLPVLEDPNRDVVSMALDALGLLARQNFTAIDRWRSWWDDNHDRHRIEWLIDSLMHDDPRVRREAGEELKTTTKEYFGYYDDLPKRERERAQSRYREWWNSVGRVRFSRSSR